MVKRVKVHLPQSEQQEDATPPAPKKTNHIRNNKATYEGVRLLEDKKINIKVIYLLSLIVKMLKHLKIIAYSTQL